MYVPALLSGLPLLVFVHVHQGEGARLPEGKLKEMIYSQHFKHNSTYCCWSLSVRSISSCSLVSWESAGIGVEIVQLLELKQYVIFFYKQHLDF